MLVWALELLVVDEQLAVMSWLGPMIQFWPVFWKLHLTCFSSDGAKLGKIALQIA
jgi:hypothetical protein